MQVSASNSTRSPKVSRWEHVRQRLLCAPAQHNRSRWRDVRSSFDSHFSDSFTPRLPRRPQRVRHHPAAASVLPCLCARTSPKCAQADTLTAFVQKLVRLRAADLFCSLLQIYHLCSTVSLTPSRPGATTAAKALETHLQSICAYSLETPFRVTGCWMQHLPYSRKLQSAMVCRRREYICWIHIATLGKESHA